MTSSISQSAQVERPSLFHRTIHSDIIINASPQEVWRVLTDWEHVKEWSPTLQSMEGEVRDGGTVSVEYTFMGRTMSLEHTLLYDEASRSFGWSDPMMPGMTDHHIYRVEALPDGRTRFVQSDEVRGGLFSLLFGWLLMREMAKTYPRFNQALKTRVESLR